MNRDDITKLAIEAGCGGIDNFEVIERFAALVAAAEREKVRASMKKAFRRMAGFIRTDEREALLETVYSYARSLSWNEDFLADVRARGDQ